MRKAVPQQTQPAKPDAEVPPWWWTVPVALLIAVATTTALLVSLWTRDGPAAPPPGRGAVVSACDSPAAKPGVPATIPPPCVVGWAVPTDEQQEDQ